MAAAGARKNSRLRFLYTPTFNTKSICNCPFSNNVFFFFFFYLVNEQFLPSPSIIFHILIPSRDQRRKIQTLFCILKINKSLDISFLHRNDERECHITFTMLNRVGCRLSFFGNQCCGSTMRQSKSPTMIQSKSPTMIQSKSPMEDAILIRHDDTVQIPHEDAILIRHEEAVQNPHEDAILIRHEEAVQIPDEDAFLIRQDDAVGSVGQQHRWEKVVHTPSSPPPLLTPPHQCDYSRSHLCCM